MDWTIRNQYLFPVPTAVRRHSLLLDFMWCEKQIIDKLWNLVQKLHLKGNAIDNVPPVIWSSCIVGHEGTKFWKASLSSNHIFVTQHILLLFQNLKPTLPTMQLSHWLTSLEAVHQISHHFYHSSSWSSSASLYFVWTHSCTGSYNSDLLPVRCISSIAAPLHWCRTRSSRGRLASCSPPPGSGPTAGRPVSSNTAHDDFTAKSQTQTSYIRCFSCSWTLQGSTGPATE